MSVIERAIANAGKYEQEWFNPASKPGNCSIEDGRLGGTARYADINSWNYEIWNFLINEFKIKTVVDIGAGTGIACKAFDDLGVDVLGIEGSKKCYNESEIKHKLVVHDFYDGPFLQKKAQLIWSCEVFEHISMEYLPNIVETIKYCEPRLLVFSAANEGQGGHCHVNCQKPTWWVNFIHSNLDNLAYHDKLTHICRSLSKANTSGRGDYSYFNRTGLVFVNRNL